MTGKRPLNGYLDRMRKNLHVLDESIESVSVAPKNEKPAEKRARLKLLRDLVELQNQTLTAIKTHLLGRDQTGSPVEPPNRFDDNDQVEFERYFKGMLAPWSLEDLKLECQDCGVLTEKVTHRTITHPYPEETEHVDLCGKCYEKRTEETANKTEAVEDPVKTIDAPASKGIR